MTQKILKRKPGRPKGPSTVNVVTRAHPQHWIEPAIAAEIMGLTRETVRHPRFPKNIAGHVLLDYVLKERDARVIQKAIVESSYDGPCFECFIKGMEPTAVVTHLKLPAKTVHASWLAYKAMKGDPDVAMLHAADENRSVVESEIKQIIQPKPCNHCLRTSNQAAAEEEELVAKEGRKVRCPDCFFIMTVTPDPTISR